MFGGRYHHWRVQKYARCFCRCGFATETLCRRFLLSILFHSWGEMVDYQINLGLMAISISKHIKKKCTEACDLTIILSSDEDPI